MNAPFLAAPALALALAATPAPALAKSAQLSIEARLERVEAELAIRRLIVDYAYRLDRRDYAGYAALFARDGVWGTGKNTYRGPDAIRAMLEKLFGPQQPGAVNAADYHLVSNPQVDIIDENHARARSRYLFIMRGPDGHPRPALAGLYNDDFVREDGTWKILHRVDQDVMPTAEEWMREMAPTGTGQ